MRGEREEAWKRTISYVRGNVRQLRRTYGNDMPIAVYEGVVVDWGKDRQALTRRVHDEYPDEHVLVVTVDEVVRMKGEVLV
jgi:hypothetical protein